MILEQKIMINMAINKTLDIMYYNTYIYNNINKKKERC